MKFVPWKYIELHPSGTVNDGREFKKFIKLPIQEID